MLLSYIKHAFRLMARNPFFAIINIAGLAVAFATFVILWRYSDSVLHSDQFHRDWKRTMLVSVDAEGEAVGTAQWIIISPLTAPLLKEAFEEIEDYSRVIGPYGIEEIDVLDHGKRSFFAYHAPDGRRRAHLEDVSYVDENFFSFYTYHLIAGATEKVLVDPSSVVLSEQAAKKYFGDEEAMGKTLYLNDSIPFTVTGVFAEFPKNSSVKFTVILSINRIMNHIGNLEPLQFSAINVIKLREGVDPGEFAPRLNQGYKARFDATMDKYFPNIKHDLRLVPTRDWAFTFPASPSRIFMYLLQAAAMLVLFMAWINYVNLTLSTNRRRETELAARQAVGAKPADLLKQFLVEATLVNTIAALLGITILQFIQKPVEALFGFYSPDAGMLTDSTVVALTITYLLGVAVTGSYPAWVILRNKSAGIFGKRTPVMVPVNATGVLKVIQYSAAVTLIIWVFSVQEQMDFVLNKELGLQTSDVVIADLPAFNKNLPQERLQGFLEELQGSQVATEFTTSYVVWGDHSNCVVKRSKEDTDIHGFNSPGGVDEHFIPFFSIKMLAGRNFNDGLTGDDRSLILSATAAKHLGFAEPADALGEVILLETKAWSLDKLDPVTVIGVCEDYYFHPLFNGNMANANGRGMGLTPSGLVNYQPARKISLKITGHDFQQSIDALRKMYERHFDGQLFSWAFLDERIQDRYVTQKMARNQILFFSFLAIGIACLGLLGLITNRVIEKTKEIGIRKVMGAGLRHITQVLLTSTIRQILVSVVIGIPAAYFLVGQFLERFSDRIEMQWWHFLAPIAILLSIMFITIVSVVWKAAHSNPVEALRYE